jgi:3-isopropylmalate dehydrogenase
MTYKIGVLEGDYIGPEIMREALKVLNLVSQKYDYGFEVIKLEASGSAYDKYGEHLPQVTIKKASECHALLKGPFGGPPEQLNHPKWSGVEKEAILPLRKIFNLYMNLRETKIYEPILNLSPIKPHLLEGVNILMVRELVSGIYFGEKADRIVNGERECYDVESYTESEIRRIALQAFKLAMKRNKKVTLVAKSNILKSSVLWREVVSSISTNYPDVVYDYMHVDNASMQLILNPKQFDVILTSNMFGDILSDEASVLSGSIGLFPSASLGDSSFGLYEPIHGSAPSIANQNKANPISAILCIALLMRYTFKDEKAAQAVESSVNEVLKAGYRTMDLFNDGDDNDKLLGTIEIGDKIAEALEKL